MPDFSQIASTYTGIQKIGEGSGGIVYKAYHERLKIPVVLKRSSIWGRPWRPVVRKWTSSKT